MFSKSWKKSVKPSGPNWMEDMTTSSASWHHVWDWRNLIWRMPFWKEIRQMGFIFCCFFGWGFISLQTDLPWQNCCTASPPNCICPIWFSPQIFLFHSSTFHTYHNHRNVCVFWISVKNVNDYWKLCCPLWQIDRMEQFFAAEGLPHLMFFYQEPEPVEAGNREVSLMYNLYSHKLSLW